MPIPNRRKDEQRDKFMSRCMSDTTMNKEYPDNGQRYAICNRQSNVKASLLNNVLANLQEKISCSECDEDSNAEELNPVNFYVPSEDEYEDFDETVEEWDCSKERPGLWENIRRKKEREGKKYRPAKPGDKDRPDPESWKKSQSNSGDEMALEQIQKMHDQLMEVTQLLASMNMDVQFQDWTKDMISKAEIYVQNVYDFVKYYEPGKYEDEYEDKQDVSESQAVEYQGRKVKLNKPFRTPDGPKKFSVYVKNEKGNVVKVNFGDPNMEIKKDIPERRRSFRARMRCETPGPKWKARYWACKSW
jgi:hypothetical protein